MTDDVKRSGLAFLLLAAITTVLLASALPQLELKPGIPLPTWETRPGALTLDNSPGAVISVSTLAKAIMGLLIGAALVVTTLQVIRRRAGFKTLYEILREILAPFLSIALLILISLGLLLSLLNVRVKISSPAELPAPTLETNGPPLGLPPANLYWLVWIGLSLALVLLAIGVIRWRADQARASNPLKLEAERAMEELRAGADLRSVIVRCYRQMSIELKKEQGIELEQTMTAREFERLAQDRGIPDAPVHQLTLLFEVARYGDRLLKLEDEQKALDCLTAIVRYSGERKQEPG